MGKIGLAFGAIAAGALVFGGYAVYRNRDVIFSGVTRGLQTHITNPINSWVESVFGNAADNGESASPAAETGPSVQDQITSWWESLWGSGSTPNTPPQSVPTPPPATPPSFSRGPPNTPPPSKRVPDRTTPPRPPQTTKPDYSPQGAWQPPAPAPAPAPAPSPPPAPTITGYRGFRMSGSNVYSELIRQGWKKVDVTRSTPLSAGKRERILTQNIEKYAPHYDYYHALRVAQTSRPGYYSYYFLVK